MKRTVKFVVIVCVLLLASTLIFTACNKQDNCKHDDPSQIVKVKAVSPTCQKTGLTEGMKCKLCGTMVVPQSIVKKILCQEGFWITDKQPTKTEKGLKHTECTMCGKKMNESTIPVTGPLGLNYKVNSDNKTCTISGIGSCTDSHLIIPCEIDGYIVTRIGESAFVNCEDLIDVRIPDSVTSIGDGAFFSCNNLTRVTIGNSITRIEESTFRYCSSLTSIDIPQSVTRIDWWVFYDCSSLTWIYYEGTANQWKDISKDYDWDLKSGSYTIYCTNAEISKDGTITYN